MQRTVGEARQQLTEMAPQLNPESWAQLDGEVKHAEAAARIKADSFAAERYTEASAVGHEAVVEVCGLRDRAAQLASDAKAGHVSAADALARLNDLRNDYRRLERSASKLARSADVIEAVEGDPIGWVDSAHARFPAIRPNFTF
jgi:hypothetical protein